MTKWMGERPSDKNPMQRTTDNQGILKMGEMVSTEKSTPTDDIWITKSSAMKASKKKKKSTDNVKQDSDSTNKLPHKFSTWQKYHLWFMFQYMNFGRAYYLPVLLISVRFNYSIFPAV